MSLSDPSSASRAGSSFAPAYFHFPLSLLGSVRVSRSYDVVVIGGGCAAFEAAVAARQAGAERVLMLEKAPEAEYGGNAPIPGLDFASDTKGPPKSVLSCRKSTKTISIHSR